MFFSQEFKLNVPFFWGNRRMKP